MHFASDLAQQSDQSRVFLERSNQCEPKFVLALVQIFYAEVIKTLALALEQIKQPRQRLWRISSFQNIVKQSPPADERPFYFSQQDQHDNDQHGRDHRDREHSFTDGDADCGHH